MNRFSRLSFRSAAKIAWREGRSSAAKFTFVMLAVAIGVGSLSGVRGFSRAFHNLLLREARTLLAADLSVRTFLAPTPTQIAVMQGLEKDGVEYTQVTDTVSMTSTSPDNPPLLVSVKAVDPRKYPFYGTVTLDPAQPLGRALTPDTAVVSDDLLMRLDAHVGDTLRLGGRPFRIAAVIVQEPDKLVSSYNVGPGLIITRQGLARAQLILPGSRAAERFLFRIPPSVNLEDVRATLKKAFPEALIADSSEAHPIVQDGLDDATTFLSLISLISMIVGALGVATAINAHLQQRLDTIAVMKCLGARSSEIMRIYVLQTVALGLGGGILGMFLGWIGEEFFPLLIAKYFPMRPEITLDLAAAAQAIGIGILTTLLFTIPPLLNIRRVRPSLIFRREMAESRPDWPERVRRAVPSLLAGLAIVVAVGGIAASLTVRHGANRVRVGEYFVGGVVVGLASLAVVAWLLLRILRLMSRRWTHLPAVVRHGVANIYRPGNHAQAALVALGVGVMFTMAVYFIQSGLIADMLHRAPPGMPNVFLLDIPATDQAALLNLLEAQKGLQRPPEMMGTVPARLVSVDGRSVMDLPLKGFERRLRRTRQVAEEDTKPAYVDLVRGRWWSAADRSGPQVCLAEEAARALHAGPGAVLAWAVADRTVTATVDCIMRVDSVHLIGRLDFVFSRGALGNAPMVYYGSVRLDPKFVAPLQMAVFRRFPTVTVVDVADVIRIVQGVVDQISTVVRFISAFAILAGLIILAASVAGTRFRRVREVVILKTLGATRAKVAGIFSMEFLILGAVAGVMGSGLANGFSALVLKRLLKADVHFDPVSSAIAVLATALVANAAGWLASFRILGQKPLEVLREE
jgi:putative ABC transport system permease protein